MFSLFALAILATGLACAGTISYSHTTPTSTTPFTDTFSLTSFDTSLGTLTGIVITLATTETAEVDIYNATGGAQAFTNAEATVPVNIVGPNSITVSATGVAGPFAGTAVPGFNPFPGVTGSSNSSGSVASADFALYEAPSVANIALSLTGNNGVYKGSANSGMFFGGSASAGALTTITYSFISANSVSSTPEPATFAMLGGALLGIGFLRRKRK